MSEEKNRIFEKIHSNPQLQILLKKIRSGKADFKDTSQYADLFSKIMGSEFSEIIPQIPHGMREQLCVELLRGSYENINEILAQVQNSIDKEKGIRLAPQKAEFPEERVKKIANSLEDETVPEETIQRRADSGTANVSRSFHDDYIKKNAEFRSNAGLKCYLERETDGKCCPWCSALAGRYLVGEQPPDIFRRHDNCGCTVVMIDGKTRQYAWSKKTWSREEERGYLKELEKKKKAKHLSREQAKALQEKNLPKSLTGDADSDIIRASGAISGALNPDSKEADKHAERYYGLVRSMKTDVSRIAKNTGYSESFIQSIKNYIFIDEHDLGDKIERFAPSYAMAESWQRLIDGRNIQPHDLTLLMHEEMERDLMKKGYTQDEAHTITSEKYNYKKEANEYYGKAKKHQKG